MNNISLKGKILLLSAFMTAVAVTIGAVSYIYSQKTTRSFETVVQHNVPAIRAVNRMLLAVRYARIELLQLTMPGTSAESDANSIKIVKEQWESYDADNKLVSDLTQLSTPEEKENLADLQKSVQLIRDDFGKALDQYKVNPSAESKERKEMIRIVTIDIVLHAKGLHDATKKTMSVLVKNVEDHSVSAFKAASTGTLMTIFTTLIGSLVGFAFAFLFSTKISKQVGQIISSISAASDEVAAAATQIASSSVELSQATTEQAASLEETAASLEEITAMISKASESADTTEKSSNESQSKAEEGRGSVDKMMVSMEAISTSNDEIMTQVNHSNQQMTEIIRVIQEIGSKTKVINEIVFQTKLLSFNASVEAARAGEHGKGFAVVAEEVGNLAQMSGNAAKEISEMLDSSISKVESIVNDSKHKVANLVSSGKEKVEAGVDTARQCSGVLDEIVQNVSRVTGLAQEIAQASKEQAQGVGEINKAMNQLGAVTQQNSATSQQAASSAEQLSAQAVSLKAAIDELVLAVQGQPNPNAGQPIKAKSKKSSNVVHIMPKKKQAPVSKSSTHSSMPLKAAAGESTPSRDSDGFDEV